MITCPTYPARPVNGGPLPLAQPKHGAWSHERKFNGWNAPTHIETGAMFNRHLKLMTIAAEFKEALAQLRLVLDCQAFKWANCEALERRHNLGRGSLIVFDVLPEPEYRSATYIERHAWLAAVLPPAPLNPQLFEENTLYHSPIEPRPAEAWTVLQEWNRVVGCQFYEGLVAKRDDSRYPFQLRSAAQTYPFWMKHRWAF